MNDTQFDQLITRSLQWEATRVAARQPSLREASSRLAERVGPSTSTRPQILLTPASAGGLNLLTMLLLLLALIAAAVFIGSLLLRTTPPPNLRPGPFGYATDCRVALREGVVYEVGTEFFGVTAGGASDENYTLWEDGTLVRGPSVSPETRSATIRATSFPSRVLTAAGVEALRERIGEAGLTPGCRSLRANSLGGRISALTNAGYVQVFWGPNVSSRPLGPLLGRDEEAKLRALVDDLVDPSSWLSGEMWIDAEQKRVQPQDWLVWVRIAPTDHEPGDVVMLPDGTTLEGADPRYDMVVLPGGQSLLEFGSPMSIADYNPGKLTEQRCGVLTRDEALALAASLDSLSMGTVGGGDFYSTDLTLEIGLSIEPFYPAIYDCAAANATNMRTLADAPSPEPTSPAGEFAGVDPCSLIPAGVAEATLQTSGQATVPSRMPLGAPADACVFRDGPLLADDPLLEGDPFSDPYYGTAMVSLYPYRVDRDLAGQIASDAFGSGTGEEDIAGLPVWTNDCFATEPQRDVFTEPLECPSAVVAWGGGRLIGFEFIDQLVWPDGQPTMMGPEQLPTRRVTHDVARAFITAVLENLADQ